MTAQQNPPKPFAEIPLAPCPCCGAKPEAHFGYFYGNLFRERRSFWISCPNHEDFRTNPFAKYSLAAADWNHNIAGIPKEKKKRE